MRLRRVAEDWLPCEPFWYALERRGLDVIAVDVPMTCPSRLERGVEVTTWGSHDQLTPFAARPAGLAAELRRRFGHHPMGDEIPVEKTPRERERIRARLVEGARRKGELSAWLLEGRAWDFFITVFGECHRGGHLLWPEEGRGPRRAARRLPRRGRRHRTADGGPPRRGRDRRPLRPPRNGTQHLAGAPGAAHHGSDQPPAGERRILQRRVVRRRGERRPRARRGFVRMLRETLPAPLQNAVARAVPVSARDRVVDRAVTGGHDWRTHSGARRAGGPERLPPPEPARARARRHPRSRRRGPPALPGPRHRAFSALRRCPPGTPLVDAVRFAHDEFPGPAATISPTSIVTWSGVPPARPRPHPGSAPSPRRWPPGAPATIAPTASAWCWSRAPRRRRGRAGPHRRPRPAGDAHAARRGRRDDGSAGDGGPRPGGGDRGRAGGAHRGLRAAGRAGLPALVLEKDAVVGGHQPHRRPRRLPLRHRRAPLLHQGRRRSSGCGARCSATSSCCARGSRGSSTAGATSTTRCKRRQRAARAGSGLRGARASLSYAAARICAAAAGAEHRGLGRQPLRRAPVPDLLQDLHGEGLGRPLRRDRRRVGGAAHPRTLVRGARWPPLLGPARGDGIRTLIDAFHYPRLGPGQMWEAVARPPGRARGTPVRTGDATWSRYGTRAGASARCRGRGPRTARVDCPAAHVVSSMPLRELVERAGPAAARRGARRRRARSATATS